MNTIVCSAQKILPLDQEQMVQPLDWMIKCMMGQHIFVKHLIHQYLFKMVKSILMILSKLLFVNYIFFDINEILREVYRFLDILIKT